MERSVERTRAPWRDWAMVFAILGAFVLIRNVILPALGVPV